MTLRGLPLARFLFLAWTLLLFPGALTAGEIAWKVGSGESLSLICQEVYGDKDLYPLVALYNGRDDATRIALGEILRLPYSETVRLGSGESLSRLAQRIWNEPQMYPVLAWANGVQDLEKIPAGTPLAVPVLIPYTLKKGESISSVAEVFYGNPKVYEVIVNASRIADPTRVPVGTVLKIPYVIPKPVVRRTPAVSARKPVPKPVEKKPERDHRTEKALNLLSRAERRFREGRYGEAWNMGDEASRDLAGVQRARAYRLLAACQYAFGKTDAALDDLRRAHELDPDFKPDPAYVNPEMMVLYKRAREK